MLASLALLLACYWVLGRILRGLLVGLQANWVARGRPPVPFVFTVRPVPVPAGEALLFASRASLWRPAPPAAPGGWTVRFGRRRALTLRAAGPAPHVRYVVAGREREARGLLVVTARRVSFRGTGRARAARVDVPLGDVAHLRLDGPLLGVERRGAPPLVVSVATAAPVARLVSAAAGRA